jgi:hypothetical protein
MVLADDEVEISASGDDVSNTLMRWCCCCRGPVAWKAPLDGPHDEPNG